MYQQWKLRYTKDMKTRNKKYCITKMSRGNWYINWLHQLCKSPICLQWICDPFCSTRSDRILPHTETRRMYWKFHNISINVFHITFYMEEHLKTTCKHNATYFRDTSLRLHCSTSERAWAPSSPMALLWKLKSGMWTDKLNQLFKKFLYYGA